MRVVGRAIKLGDDVNTDLIIAGRYKFRCSRIEELVEHVFEDLDPGLARRLRNAVIVAGRNFGCGSSREHAPLVLKAAGVRAVVAISFARIFFRNSVNLGLPVVEVPGEFVEQVADGDTISVRLEEGVVEDVDAGLRAEFKPYPPFLLKIVETGGLVKYFKAKGAPPWRSTRSR